MSRKSVTDDFHALDVVDLKHRGALAGNCLLEYRWKSFGQIVAGVLIQTIPPEALVLRYAWNGMAIEKRVELSYSTCRFGGSRPWFLCPNADCGKRVRKLYAPRFLCRHCLNLGYASQYESLSTKRLWQYLNRPPELLSRSGHSPASQPWLAGKSR